MGNAHKVTKSFTFAFSGIKTAFEKEPNFKIHTIAATLALILASILGFSLIEWLILLLTIALVLIVELINTSVEALVNIVSPEIQEGARVAKDVLAASVLISAILATIVGVFLFLPKILLWGN